VGPTSQEPVGPTFQSVRRLDGQLSGVGFLICCGPVVSGGEWIRPGELKEVRRAEVVRRPRKTPDETTNGNYSYAMAA